MGYVSTADWVLILAYLGGVVAFGAWIGRGQRDARDYFLGGRDLPWWGVGLSIVATETSALTFIGVPALAYGGNLGFIQIVLGYVIARIVLAIVLVPHYFRREIYSPYELLSHAFGPSARRAAAVFFLVAGLLAAGVRVYVTCIPLRLVLGLEMHYSILLFVILSLIYTFWGGIKAVIWTEVGQFALFVGGGIFTLFFLPGFLGGWSAGVETARAAGKLEWLDLRFSLGAPFNLWMGLIGATVHVLFSHGADQLIVQRVLTCRSVADGRKALVLSAAIILPLFLMFLLTGALLWVYYQAHPFAIPLPATAAGFGQNDYVYPIFILTVIPPVAKGLMIVAILAAAMSSVSAALSALASVSVMDLSRGRDLDPVRRLWTSRLSTLVWGGLLGLVAYASREVTFVLNAALSLTGLTSGAMLGALILALYSRRGRSGPVIWGMIVSFLAMTALFVLPRWSITREFWTTWVGLEVFWPWYTLIGTGITLATAVLARAVRTREPPLTVD